MHVDEGVWTKLRGLNIPLKVKNWLWRCCNDFLPKKVHLWSKDDVAGLAMVSWRLWKERNSRCWDGKSSTVRRVVSDASDFLQE
ncbi:hypothetical protein ACS0TY_028151 [Phlomoides rotata]